MTTLPSVPCADCGSLLWSSSASLPPGQRRCHACRRANPAKPSERHSLVCQFCGSGFRAQHAWAKFCSPKCSSRYGASMRPTLRSPDDHRVKRSVREHRAAGLTHRQRALLLRKWKAQHRPCIYCGAPATSIDHVVPLVRGGNNFEGNLAPACRLCNSTKNCRTVAEWRHDRTAARTWTDVSPRPRKARIQKPGTQLAFKLCRVCGALAMSFICSEECRTERGRRAARDSYRSAHGLAVDPGRPSKKFHHV